VKAADAFTEKTTAPNQLCRPTSTYIKLIGWGWFYLSTILDDYSRYIIAGKLCATAGDVTDMLERALAASGCDSARVVHKPRLLSDNGASYVAGDLARWLEAKGMTHVRGAPNHPQTQGKIERWHQTLKNRVLLENYFLPGQLEAAVAAFVEQYNYHRHSREPGKPHPGRRLLRPRSGHPSGKAEDQEADHPKPPLEPSRPGSLTCTDEPEPSYARSAQMSQIP
jgi:putative transposase